MKKLILTMLACMAIVASQAQSVRQVIRLDEGWKFAFGHAADNGRDIAVVTVEVQDAKGRIVPDACPSLSFRLDGDARIIGAGNGDPAYLGADHPEDINCRAFQIPAFNGLAQVLIQSSRTPSDLTLSVSSDGLKTGTVAITTR